MQIAMIGGMPYTGVRDAILTHPTLLEGLIVLFSSTPSKPHPGGDTARAISTGDHR